MQNYGRVRLPAILATAIISTMTSCIVGPRSGATAVSQRPFFSTDANTVEEGSTQIELGLALDPGDRADTPVLVTHGLSERSQFLIGISPWVYVDRPGDDGSGPGDLLVGFKHRVLDQNGALPSAAFQLFTKLPTGSENQGISSGELDFFAAGILTRTLEDWTFTANYELGVLGEATGAGTDLQHTVAFNAAHPLRDDISVFGELDGILTPERDREEALLGVGFAWSPRKSTVVDAGLILGLTGDAPDLQLLVGMTVNFGAPPKRRE